MTNKKSIPHIAIIGAGQLGSRHLQGLAKLEHEIDVIVIDPAPRALQTARIRYHEIPENRFIQSVSFMESMDQLKNSIEFAIIATNADVRRDIIETLVTTKNVNYLILEKVAFQSVKDFQVVISFLEEKKIKAWVNCSRRMFSFFQELKKRTMEESKVSLTVEGSNWGLACNAIHMLDLLAFLTGQIYFKVDEANLDSKIYDSKRKGFLELGGRLLAKSERGDTLELTDERDQDIPFRIFISFDGVEIEIDQIRGLAFEYPEGRRELSEEKPFHVPLQSELTGIQVKEILQTGNSRLTSLHESYLLHRPILEAFNLHLERVLKRKVDLCPIT